MLELLLRASKEDGASEVLKQLAELEALPCNNDTELAAIEDAGAQLSCVMRTRFSLRASLFRLSGFLIVSAPFVLGCMSVVFSLYKALSTVLVRHRVWRATFCTLAPTSMACSWPGLEGAGHL
jgi:hypothetical protein